MVEVVHHSIHRLDYVSMDKESLDGYYVNILYEGPYRDKLSVHDKRLLGILRRADLPIIQITSAYDDPSDDTQQQRQQFFNISPTVESAVFEDGVACLTVPVGWEICIDSHAILQAADKTARDLQNNFSQKNITKSDIFGMYFDKALKDALVHTAFYEDLALRIPYEFHEVSSLPQLPSLFSSTLDTDTLPIIDHNHELVRWAQLEKYVSDMCPFPQVMLPFQGVSQLAQDATTVYRQQYFSDREILDPQENGFVMMNNNHLESHYPRASTVMTLLLLDSKPLVKIMRKGRIPLSTSHSQR